MLQPPKVFSPAAKSAEALGLPQILAAIGEQASTALGRAAAEALMPLADAPAARQRLAQGAEAQSLVAEGIALPLPPEHDVSALLAEAKRNKVLEGGELTRCWALATAAVSMAQFALTHSRRAPELASVASVPAEARAQLSALAEALSAALEPNGEVRDDASPALARLRARGRALRLQIRNHLSELTQSPEVAPYLQEAFVALRHNRHCLPVVASFQSKVAGIVHAASQSSETLFIEPASAIAWGNQDAVLTSQAEAETERVLARLSALVAEQAPSLTRVQQQLTLLDVVQATARLANKAKWQRPTIGEQGTSFELPGLQHAQLALARGRAVGNDVSLPGGGHGLLISGPNAGGKTALLTAIGLAVAMAQRGLPIATQPGATLPFVRRLHVTLGDGQSLSAGLSSFTAHLQALDHLYRSAEAFDVVLVDEIGGATDPDEGAAIAQAALQSLVGRNVALVASTHLAALKTLPLLDHRFVNARMGVAPSTLAPTYRLELGLAGESFALDAAARLPVAPDLLAAARAVLATQPSELRRAIAQMTAREQAASKQLAELEGAQTRLQQATLEARAKVAEAERAAADWQAKAQQQAADVLARELLAWRKDQDAARLDGAVASLRAEVKAARAGRPQQAERASGAASNAHAADLLREPSGAIAAGSSVWLSALGQRGEVLDLDGSAANVQVGAMRMRVNLTELTPVATGSRPGRAGGASKVILAEAPAPFAPGVAGSGAPGRIDLRGLRAEAAAKALERALDASLAEGTSSLWVVHGHGTGALREQVRACLDASPYVGAWRPGDRHEGGDGVTIAELDK